MVSSDEIELTVQVPHEFAVELNLVVVTNHQFTIKQINTAEQEAENELYRAFADEADGEILGPALSQSHWHYDELRQAANRLALVGAVTRLGHWINMLVKRTGAKLPKSGLISQLEHLELVLGCGPEPKPYFKDLVDVRDSIIHASAEVQWVYGKKRRLIAARYRSAYGTIDFSEEDFGEAVAKMIRQVSWYDDQIGQRT